MAVPLSAHPSPLYYNKISGGHIGRGVVQRRCSAGPVLLVVMTSDLENLFSNGHSHDAYLWKV